VRTIFDFSIKQFANVLRLQADLLYFAAGRLTDDIPRTGVSEEQILAAAVRNAAPRMRLQLCVLM
jgi:hypothetical protein